MKRLVLLFGLLAGLTLTQNAFAAGESPDAFTGAWLGADPGDGSTLRVQISAPDASGIRRVTLVDQFASACDAPATAIGSGSVSGAMLFSTLTVRCGGMLLADDVPFTFELVGDTLVNDGVVFTASPTRDAYTGAWQATDPSDGSTLTVHIGAPDASGIRRVTLVDQFASACDAPATAIGSGSVSGAVLFTTLAVRCGGMLLADDVPFTFELEGDTLVNDGVIFARAGGS